MVSAWGTGAAINVVGLASLCLQARKIHTLPALAAAGIFQHTTDWKLFLYPAVWKHFDQSRHSKAFPPGCHTARE